MIYACFRDIFITVTWLLLLFYYLYPCWYFLCGSAGTSYLGVCTQAKRELTESVWFWCHQFAMS